MATDKLNLPPATHDTPKMATMGDGELDYAGIATLFRCPVKRLDDLAGYDVAAIGVPYDAGMAFRTGARFAPRAIRELSFRNIVPRRMYDLADRSEAWNVSHIKLADVGDVTIAPLDARQTRDAVVDAVARLRRSVLPVVLGGDHSVTYGAVAGCLQGGRAASIISSVGLLCFDADLDVETSYLSLPRYWHGDFLRCLIEDGHLQGQNVVVIGARGLVDESVLEFCDAVGIRIYTSRDVTSRGIDAVMDDAMSYLNSRVDGV